MIFNLYNFYITGVKPYTKGWIGATLDLLMWNSAVFTMNNSATILNKCFKNANVIYGRNLFALMRDQ